MASTTFIINDRSLGGANPTVQVTITEIGNGKVRFDVVQLVDSVGDYAGDLRGFFFDVKESSVSPTSLKVTDFDGFGAAGTQILDNYTEVRTGNDTVKDLGDGATMGGLNGSGQGDTAGYDIGIEIGTSSVAANNDVRAISFTLEGAGGLTLADFVDMDFGIRVASVGKVTSYDPTTGTYTLGSRTGTSTLVENAENHDAVINSDGGGATATIDVAENTTAVTTVTGTDADGNTLFYKIVGGADEDRFTIDATTGALSFKSAPDFEAPADADGNNSYVVKVLASDGLGGNDYQTITVNVTDVEDSAAFAAFALNGPSDSQQVSRGVISINTTDKVGYNQLQSNDGDLLEIGAPIDDTSYGCLKKILGESAWGGNQDNNIDALHILDDGRILFSTASGKVQIQNANSLEPNPGLGQVDLFLFTPGATPGTGTVSIPSAGDFPALNFLAAPAFANAAKDKIDALSVLDDGSIIFSTLGGFSIQGTGNATSVSFNGNDLIHWNGTTATKVFDASDDFANAYLYSGTFDPDNPAATGKRIGSDIGDNIDALHVLKFDGGVPTHFIISTTGDVKSTTGAILFKKEQLIEIRADGDGNYWVNQKPYYDSGKPGENGEDIDAFWLADEEGEDDTPTTGENDLVIVDEDDLPNGVGDTTSAGDDLPQNATGDMLAFDFGDDGPGAVSLTNAGSGVVINGVTYTYTVSTTTTTDDTLTVNDGTQNVLRVTITNATTGAYTVELLARLEHDNANGSPGFEDNIDFTFTYQVTDGNGTTADGTFMVRVDDDIPALKSVGGSDTATVEDEKTTGGNDELGDGGVGVVNGSIVDNVNWGADDFDSATGFSVAGDPTVFAAGSTVYWGQTGAFNGTTAGGAAASLVVNGDGSYTYTILDNLLLGTDVQGEQTNTLATVSITGKDQDGDTQAVSVQLDVTDDIPALKSVGGSDTATVEDEKTTGGNDELGDGGVGSVNGSIVDNVNWGADDFDSATGFSVAGDPTVFAAGATVYWGQTGTFNGTTAGGAAASLVVNGDGSYTYTILDNLLLGTDVQGEQTNTLATVSITGKDQDGDTQAVSVQLDVTDDIPALKSVGGSDTATVEDEKTTGGNDELGDGGVGSVNGSIVDNVNWGADDFDSATGFSVAGDPTVFAAGSTVYWGQTGAFNGTTAGGAAASLVVNGDGSYTYTILDNLLLGTDVQGEQTNTLATVSITGKDQDGDTQAVSVQLDVTDDIPALKSVGGSDTATVEDEKTTGGNDELGDGGVGSVNGSIVDNVNWGADDFDSATGFSVAGDPTVFAAGSTVYWGQTGAFNGTTAGGAAASLVVNGDGSYTYTILDNLLLGTDVQGEQTNTLATVSITGKDQDGDTQAVSVQLDVTDDIPALKSVGGSDTATVEDEKTTGGNDELGDGGVGSVNGSIVDNVNWGADDFDSATGFSVAGDPTVFAAGSTVYWGQTGAFNGTTAGGAAASLVVNGDGSYTYTILDNLLLGTDVQGEQTNTLATVSITGKDQDGDTQAVSVQLDVTDDIPALKSVGGSDTATVEDEKTTGGNDELGDGGVGSVNGSIVDNVNWGADDFDSATGFSVAGDPTVFAAGSTVYWGQTGAFNGTTAGGAAASLVVNGDGSYTYTILDNLLLGTDVQGEQTNTLATVSITGKDQDGDTQAVSVQLDVTDDIPALKSVGGSDTATVEDEKTTGGNDELGDGGVGSVNGSIVDNVNWGADDFDSATGFSVAGDPTVFAAGSTVYWGQTGAFNGTTAGGAAASLVVNGDGSYTYTILDNLLLGTDVQGEQTNTLATVSITGKDQDGDTQAVSVQLDVTDDIPALKSVGGSDTATVEDEKTTGGNDELGDGGVGSVNGSIVDNVNWGADDFDSATGFSVAGDPTVFAAGATVYWGQTGTFNGTTAGGAAASLVVNGDGSYTYTILDNLLLGTDVQGEQTNTLATVSITGKDQDGDTQAVSVQLDVTDDIPALKSVGGSDTATVEDEKTTGGNDELGDGGVGSVNGSIVDNVNWGADDFDSATGFSVAGDPTVFAAGSTVYWGQTGAFNGTTAGGAAASLVVNGDGSYTYTILDNLLLGTDVQGEQTNTLATVSITGKDQDGDTQAVSVQLDVTDDIPALKSVGGSDTATVEDEKTTGGNDELGDGGVGVVNGSIVDNVNWGADDFDSATGFSVAGDPTVFAAGSTVYWGQTGAFNGTTAGGAAASLVVNGDGSYTYTILDNLLLGTDVQGEQTNTLATVSITGKDQDGDTQAVSVQLDVTDDIPTAVDDTDSVFTFGGGETATGNVITDASAGDAGDADTGADSPGADGGTVTGIASNNPGGDPFTAVGAGVTIDGQYGTLTINPDGSYTYTVSTTAPPLVPSNEVFTYTLTDGDGDTDTATLTINVVPPTITELDEMKYWTSSHSSWDTVINRVTFQAGLDNLSTQFKVVLSVDGGTFAVSNGPHSNFPNDIVGAGATTVDNVSVTGSTTGTLTLVGTLANINALIASNKIAFDAADDTVPIATRLLTIQLKTTGDVLLASDTANIVHQVMTGHNDAASVSVNGLLWNTNDSITYEGNNGNDSVITTWTHRPDTSQINYKGGGHTTGDTINLVFTPFQLEQILTNAVDASDREALHDFLRGNTVSADFASTDWHGIFDEFEDGKLSLLVGHSDFAEYVPATSGLTAGTNAAVLTLTGTTTPAALNGTAVGEILLGRDNAALVDTLNGDAGNDILVGRAGIDNLNGDAGDDMLLGGVGNDVLNGGLGGDLVSGGLGADTFVLADAGAANADTIVDYSYVEGDVLDVSALVAANYDIGDPISDFVQITTSGDDVIVSVDADGGVDNFVIAATLKNYGANNQSLVRLILENEAPVANGDSVITNVGPSAAVVIPEAWLLANDTDAESNPIDVTGVGGASGGSVAHAPGSGSAGSVTFTDDATLDGSFTYQATDGQAGLAATVTVDNNTTGTTTLVGAAGSQIIIGGATNDTIRGAAGDDFMDGGAGTADVLDFSDATGAITFTLVQSAADTAVNLTSVGLGTDTYRNMEGVIGGGFNDKLIGGSGADIISGGAGDDRLTGNLGADNLTGGLGVDQFRLRTDGGTETITDFIFGTDKIGFLEGSGGAPAVNFGVTGTAAGAALTAGDGNFTTRASIAAIDDGDDNQVVVITTAQTTAEIGTDSGTNINNLYVVVFNSDTGKAEVWFDTNWGNTGGGVKVATLDGVTAGEVALLSAGDFVVYDSPVDPIILDLGAPGISFSGLDNGVSFDINADGLPDQIAWTTGEDGILALDVDGNGSIDNGAEIFSPYFPDGTHASGVAALASLDSNNDGVMDSADAEFGNLKVWQDLNHDGVSDAGELMGLADHGIASISLAATASDGEIDGQQLLAEGAFNYADGTSGAFVEVALSAAFGTPSSQTLIGGAEADTLSGGAADDTLQGGLGIDILSGGAGADSFIFGEAGSENADTILDYSMVEGDTLTLSALLDGTFGATDNVSDFVQLVESGANITVQVNSQAGSGEAWQDVAILGGYGTADADPVKISIAGNDYVLIA